MLRMVGSEVPNNQRAASEMDAALGAEHDEGQPRIRRKQSLQ